MKIFKNILKTFKKYLQVINLSICSSIEFMNIQELKDTYTANLRNFRKNKKMNQAEISEKVGITEKFYNDLETGRKWGSFETIVDLANAFGVEPYELFLPAGSVISHNERRTKDLMKRLRANFSELVDTMEDFLED